MSSLIKYDGFLPTSFKSFLYRVAHENKTMKPSTRIVLVVDISGSMFHNMDVLKKALLSLVDLLLRENIIASVNSISLITFQSYPRLYDNLRSYQQFTEIVSEMRADGGTQYSSALNSLHSIIAASIENVTTVLFSDGEPSDNYFTAMEMLKQLSTRQSFMLHSIGLNVHDRAEQVLRELAACGSVHGYYQSISNDEIENSMLVLTSHLDVSREGTVNEKRTYNGFVILEDDVARIDVKYGDNTELLVPTVVSPKLLLESDRASVIFEVANHLLTHTVNNYDYQNALSLIDHVAGILDEVQRSLSSNRKEKLAEIADKRNAKIAEILNLGGVEYLRRRSDIVAEFNKNRSQILSEDKALQGAKQLADLCTRIRASVLEASMCAEMAMETNDVSKTIANMVSKFRDESIASQRKKLGNFARKVAQTNIAVNRNIDERLKTAVDELIGRGEPIVVPEYFRNYADPITLDSFEDIILNPTGVFMLLFTVKRHYAGLVSAHLTTVLNVGNFSSSVIETLTRNAEHAVDSTSEFFDFRGIGSGNAAVPLWISEQHWSKARHTLGPFVGHAVSGNENEYTSLQAETLLALLLLHLRYETPAAGEHHLRVDAFVAETLAAVVDRKKWRTVDEEVANTEENLANEAKIPSIEVFQIFREFVGAESSSSKESLLLAELYRRANKRRITTAYQELLTNRDRRSRRKPRRSFLHRLFPRIFERYFDMLGSTLDVDEPVEVDYAKIDEYFVHLLEDRDALVKSFDFFANKKLRHSLFQRLAASLGHDQKMALVLSAHKCLLLRWNKPVDIPAGLSTDPAYVERTVDWCRRSISERNAKFEGGKAEETLVELLGINDKNEAKKLLQNICRDSHAWGVLLKILFFPVKTRRPREMPDSLWKQKYVEDMKERMKRLAVPLHFELQMYCIFQSMDDVDWVPEKMVWRPRQAIRRRIQSAFPHAPKI